MEIVMHQDTACFKFFVKDLEISLAMDREIVTDNSTKHFTKCDLRVFKGNIDITEKVTGKEFLGNIDEADFLGVISKTVRFAVKNKG